VHIGIGETLREARNRRKVGLAEVEAATKIRVRYLRAIENEEWDVLPGDAYTRGFIRAYSSYLGLDGERLAEEYRHSTEPPAGERVPRVEPAATGGGGGGRRGWAPGRAVLAALVAGLLAAAVAIGLLAGGNDGATPGTESTKTRTTDRDRRAANQPGGAPGVAVQLAARAEVWVCLLDADGNRLIDGQILEEGAEEGPFRSAGFSVSFGNGEVALLVDGREAEIPATPSPLGYKIDSGGELTELGEAERPTCT
jgi:cytoskeleton protein RodZ